MTVSIPTNPTDPHLRPLESLYARHVLPICPRTDRPTQRRFHIRAHHLVSRISGLRLRFAETGYPAFGEADADVYFMRLERCDHMAGAGGEGDQCAWQGEVGAGEVEGSGEMF